ncbi:hypothetical protein V3C99_018278 [Haemonchus contortus]
MLEIEQIEEDSNLHTILADANELGFMLTTRLDEAKCARDRLDVKLGYTTQKAQRLQELSLGGEDHRSQINPDEGSEQGPSSQNRTPSVGVADETQSVECINPPRSCRSIRPPQASLPKFHGDAEDFPEFWAVFETLVHKSNELDVMEKILLLKESLVGKAQNSIKGIRLVPENYNWLVQTLQSSYSDLPVNRAQIVKKLFNLRSAGTSAESCLATFDQIQVLVHQMISAGYDVRNTCDPIWSESILSKFPQDVVKPVLKQGRSQDSTTTGELMAQLKNEIADKHYVEGRMGHAIGNNSTKGHNTAINSRPQFKDKCIFCHKNNHSSFSCRTVTDQSRRRKIIKDENRCWKCCSSSHNSFDCQRADCPRCGQKHHMSLCVKKDDNVTTGQKDSRNNNQRDVRKEHPSRSQGTQGRSHNNLQRNQNGVASENIFRTLTKLTQQFPKRTD